MLSVQEAGLDATIKFLRLFRSLTSFNNALQLTTMDLVLSDS